MFLINFSGKIQEQSRSVVFNRNDMEGHKLILLIIGPLCGRVRAQIGWGWGALKLPSGFWGGTPGENAFLCT